MKLARGNRVLVGYVLVLVLVRIWFGGLYKGITGDYLAGWLRLGTIVVGLLAGWILPAVDHLIYWYTYPHELTPMRGLELMKAKRYGETFSLLRSTENERGRLVLHGILFQAVFAVFAFWVISSAGNDIGRGLVLGVLLNLLIWDYGKIKGGETQKIFWQIKRVVEKREGVVAVGVMGAVFTYLTLAIF